MSRFCDNGWILDFFGDGEICKKVTTAWEVLVKVNSIVQQKIRRASKDSTRSAAYSIVNYGWAGLVCRASSTEATATAYNINEMSWLLPSPVALLNTITETVWVIRPPSQNDNNVLSF